ncbi:MAG: hypothetical protein Q7T36_05400 [Fluviicoccus sp.]|nr:hypothetical protein [Fluviicoccus sp.]
MRHLNSEKLTMKTLTLISIIGLLTLTGCASNSAQPSFGDQLAARGEKAQAISKQWNSGSSAVAKGEKMIAKGQELITDGKKDQTKGEKLVEDGRKLVENGKQQMADSEAAYQNMRATPVPATAPQ